MHVLIYYQLFKQIYKRRKEETTGLKYKSFINRMVSLLLKLFIILLSTNLKN